MNQETTQRPQVSMTMETGAVITFELYPDKAPNSVNGLLEMIGQEAFDQMVIQRLVPDFVFQPWYDESVMDERFQYMIEGEFAANGFEGNDLPFDKYTVGMAGDGAKTSNSCCFFITVGETRKEYLQGRFAAIGKVVSGFEELERIMGVPMVPVETGMTGAKVNKPVKDEVIRSIRVDLRGYEPQPVKKFLPESYLASLKK